MTALSKTGERQLAEAEAVIERGLATFMEVGSALSLIRDGRLYRADHDTFEAYCQGRWGFTARRANQLMDAAQIGTMVPIANERQARALASLKDDPEALRETYEKAEASGDTTAAGLAAAAAPPGVDPETGEIESAGASTSDGEVIEEGSAPPSVDGPTPADSTPRPSMSPDVPLTQGGPEGYRAAATRARSTVRSHLLSLDAERIAATADEPAHWADFSTDVREWLDTLDASFAGPHLKAVQ